MDLQINGSNLDAMSRFRAFRGHEVIYPHVT